MNCLIIGCGLTGTVIARELAEKGQKVAIWERRGHIGGNMYDYKDEYGILVHQYGPHTFHTNDAKLAAYMQKYAAWKDYRLKCMSNVNGKATPMPFNFQTIDDFYPPDAARVLKERIRAEFGGRDTATVLETLDSQDPLVSAYARFLFDSDYSLYTAKQWGISPAEIDPSVLRRVPLYFSYDDGYFSDKYQFMPEASYSALFEKLLNHPNIEVELNCEALERLGISESGDKLLIDGSETDMPVFYTGALDELFQCSDGPLPYRSLRFEWKHEDIDSFQPAAVVAYPQAEGFTRITEYKKLPVQQVAGTTYAVEYSAQYQFGGGTEPYYPVMTAESQKRYEIYRVRAGRIHNLYCCGRLADFKYYNMDQALERALDVSGGFVSSQRMN